MLQVGDHVVSSSGICKIAEETWQNFSGEDKLYFVLVPLHEKRSKVYVPVEKAEQRLRKAMTNDEAGNLIDSLKSMPEIEIENEKTCEKDYKAATYSGNPVMVARAIKTIYARMQDRIGKGKKVTAVDERYYKAAVHILCSELAYSLGSDENEVEAKLISSLQ